VPRHDHRYGALRVGRLDHYLLDRLGLEDAVDVEAGEDGVEVGGALLQERPLVIVLEHWMDIFAVMQSSCAPSAPDGT